MSDPLETRIIGPDYMKTFQCIGGECEDTCCQGWAIMLDSETIHKYDAINNKSFNERFKKDIVDGKYIKLKKNRCAFLDEKGWCEIYRHLGENYLSHTCKLYPRTINKVNHQIEYSLALSCPEASRKVLLNPEGIRFIELSKMDKPHLFSAELQIDLEKRMHILSILQDYKVEFEKRLQKLDVESYTIRKYLELALFLKQLFKSKKCASRRYEKLLENVLEGLKLRKQVKFKVSVEAFQDGYNRYHTFMKEHPYILENYFVNYCFERCVPYDTFSEEESMKKLEVYYNVIKIHLIGLAAFEQKLTLEMCVDFIQAFSKVYDHGEDHMAALIDLL